MIIDDAKPRTATYSLDWMGQRFGATVMAEDVETEEQYLCLAEEGRDQTQGFLLSRPTSAEAVARMPADFHYGAAA